MGVGLMTFYITKGLRAIIELTVFTETGRGLGAAERVDEVTGICVGVAIILTCRAAFVL